MLINDCSILTSSYHQPFFKGHSFKNCMGNRIGSVNCKSIGKTNDVIVELLFNEVTQEHRNTEFIEKVSVF